MTVGEKTGARYSKRFPFGDNVRRAWDARRESRWSPATVTTQKQRTRRRVGTGIGVRGVGVVKALRGHREHAEERRLKRVTGRFNAAEYVAVTQAAARDGLKPGAWVAAVATTAAARPVGSASMVQRHPELEGLRSELLAVRRLATNISGNLNDVAKHANSTGELKGEVVAMMEFIRKLARRMDRVIEDIRMLTR